MAFKTVDVVLPANEWVLINVVGGNIVPVQVQNAYGCFVHSSDTNVPPSQLGRPVGVNGEKIVQSFQLPDSYEGAIDLGNSKSYVYLGSQVAKKVILSLGGSIKDDFPVQPSGTRIVSVGGGGGGSGDPVTTLTIDVDKTVITLESGATVEASNAPLTDHSDTVANEALTTSKEYTDNKIAVVDEDIVSARQVSVSQPIGGATYPANSFINYQGKIYKAIRETTWTDGARISADWVDYVSTVNVQIGSTEPPADLPNNTLYFRF